MRTSLMMTTARSAAVLAIWVLAASCSANSEGSSFGNNTGGASGGGGAAGSGGTQNILGDGSVGDGSLDEAGACTGNSFPGKVVPLDVLILLDATASMDGSNGSPVVWPSVTAALQSLISDPMSEGIGMGLTFLPNKPAAGFQIPSACQANTDCGLYGPCMPWYPNKICTGSLSPSVSCDPGDYGQPVVPIDTLPSNKSALISAITGKSPDGAATPTQPALTGALSYAHGWAVDHPTHLTNVLFATDGDPNDCTTNSAAGAAEVAATAYADSPSVSTFVLGLGELANLNQIASSGGTGQAYLADSSNVGNTLVHVFNEIRANGACQFQIPPAPAGETLDYNRVNVSYTPLTATEPTTVYYVTNKAGCDPTTGGWYYDVEPKDGTPSKILLCDATCSDVKLSDQGVSVILGCANKVK